MLAPFDKNRDYDIMLENVIKCVDKGIKSDDDFLLVCGGDAGSGKTHLSFHAETIYLGEQATVRENMAMTPKDFATVLESVSKAKGKKYLCYDEANVSKRQAMTKWNTKLIDLYMNIRGLNILHWWNNPSIEMLDKHFISERVKGFIFITTKDKKRPRLYLYFTKEGLLNLLEEQKNLKKRTIVKYGPKYALYMGWFKSYKGPLLEEYKKMKEDRMHEKVKLFKEEFAPADKKNTYNYSQENGIAIHAARRIVKYGLDSKLLEEGVHYTISGSGVPQFSKKGIEQLDYIRINRLHDKRLVKNKQKPKAPPKTFRKTIPNVSIVSGQFPDINHIGVANEQ